MRRPARACRPSGGAALLLTVAFGAFGCGGTASAPEPRPASPPVILVSLDTLRSDAVGPPGSGESSNTPHIDRLIADSVEFTAAVAEIPFTLSAHMAMLTGAAPDVHGVLAAEDRLTPDLTTLAERLSAAGYATAGVVSSDWLRPGFGFGRGFDTYEEVDTGLEFSARINRVALESLDRMVAAGRPPFLFVHYYDAHSDAAARGNRRPYWAPEALSTGLDESCREGLCSPAGECATGYLLWASHHHDEVSPEVRDCLHDSYLAGVRALDGGVGELIAALQARGIYEPALIVLTSDHGEEFGEHGQYVHAQTHHESVAVPLAFKLPNGKNAGSTSLRPAQLADILPTVLGALDLEVAGTVTGEDLLVAGEDGGKVILTQNKHRPERYALTEGSWKLIHDYVTGRSTLFDRAADPRETVDLAARRPDVVKRLEGALDARVRRHRETRRRFAVEGATESDVLDSEARRRLEALGYVD